uniref:Uncharacterized protein n=1 Tax=Pygocentrus nattereri TaxID=42514 RepID=A0AAR2JKV4_PYGNA
MATAVEDTSVLEEDHNFFLPCLWKLKGRSERGQKNFKLANIADGFQCCSAPPTGLRGCDYCPPEPMDTNKGSTALKTCLKCEVSMCPEHVQPHLELPAFREHPLVEPLGEMRKKKCAEHDEMFRYSCVDERTFLSNACTIEGGHSGHNIKNTMKDMWVGHFMHSSHIYMQHENSTRLEGFLSSLCESLHMHEAEHSLSVQQNLNCIAEDRSRLADIHTGIEGLLQEHDPFQFIKVSDSCRGPHLYCPTKAKNCDFTNSETGENHCSGLHTPDIGGICNIVVIW